MFCLFIVDILPAACCCQMLIVVYSSIVVDVVLAYVVVVKMALCCCCFVIVVVVIAVVVVVVVRCYCSCLFCYIWSFVKRETVSEQVISSSILNVSGSRGYFSDVLTLACWYKQTDRQSLLDWNIKTKRNLPVTGHVDRRVINVRSLHLQRF